MFSGFLCLANALSPLSPRRSKSAVPLVGGTANQMSEETEQKARADAERAIKARLETYFVN